MRGRHHDSRFEGILKMKLQASDASAPEGLQSQNLSRPENRLSVNGLAIVHGRLVRPGALTLLGSGSVQTAVLICSDRTLPYHLTEQSFAGWMTGFRCATSQIIWPLSI